MSRTPNSTNEGHEGASDRYSGPGEASGREGIPAPMPCPFTRCTQGPFGRDELNAHLAECPEAKVMQDRINDLKRRVDEHEAYYEDSHREMFGDYPRSEQ